MYMDSYPLFRLGEIFKIARGGSPRPINDYLTDSEDGLNWIMIGDTKGESKYITRTKKKIRKEGLAKSRMVYPGDFLLTNSMSFGRPYIMSTEGCIHDGWLVLSPKDDKSINTDFFYYLLGSDYIYRKFCQLAPGTTVKNLNIDLVKSVKVPLPPIYEQKRITNILSKADNLRKMRQESIQKLDELSQSIFLEMFGDPIKNSKHFPVGTIADLVKSTQYGTSQKAGPVGEYPILRMGNITYCGKFDLSDLKYFDLDEKSQQKYLASHGDLLFNRTNSRELVGKTAVYYGEKPMAYAGYLVKITPNKNSVPEFISALLNSRHGKSTLKNMAKNIVGMANINAKEVQTIKTIIPPLDLQNQFRTRLEKLREFEEKLLSSKEYMDQLFNSLMQKAFRGELEFNDQASSGVIPCQTSYFLNKISQESLLKP